MLWLCFQLPSCLLGNTRDMSVMYEKAKCVLYLYAAAKNENQICSYKHETGLALCKQPFKVLSVHVEKCVISVILFSHF